MTEGKRVRGRGDIKKTLGQHFLTNPGIALKMVGASGITADFGVIEIGPGRGALTKELVKTAGKVVAIELDGDLIPGLEKDFETSGKLSLIHKDALEVDFNELINTEFAHMPVAIFGNLPYYITSPIVMKLLESKLSAEMIVVMVQKEAARRLAAKERSREVGAVTLAVRYFSEPELLFDVAPGSFYPVPKVTSTVVKLSIRKGPPVAPGDEALMFAMIRAAFAERRKFALNSMSARLPADKAELRKVFGLCGIDPSVRAEQLSLADYAALAECFTG